MTIEEELLNKVKIDFNKISEYGFIKDNSGYNYSKNIMNNTFRVNIVIDNNGILKGKIYDLSFGDEYTNFRIENSTSSFIKQVRKEFKNILIDIINNCSTKEKFTYEQSNRITKLIKEQYGDNPEFKWQKFPNYAIFRNKDSKKWYGIIMNLDKGKLDTKDTGEIEIINVKLEPNQIKKLLKKKGFYPAYHMNKKNWITIILNDTIEDDYIMKLIEKSYSYTLN